MPFGDGTGPMGLGPMTGRAAGYCAGYPAPGFTNPIPGRGLGWRRGFYPYSGDAYPGTGYYGSPYLFPYTGSTPGYMNPGYYGYPYAGFMPNASYGPFGFGRGFGRGRGRGRWF